MLLNAVVIGLGAIGRDVGARLLQAGAPLRLIGVVDSSPALVGKNLRDVLGALAPDTAIVQDISAIPAANVAIVTTGSRLSAVMPTLLACLRQRISVVSSCEELIFPAHQHPKLAAELQHAAADHGVCVLGAGINPGYAMDALALALTGACGAVERITCTRTLDAATRRTQLQNKIGAGLPQAEILAQIERRELGHVGLAESTAMLAAGMNWTLTDIQETFEPVIAQQPHAGSRHISSGAALGMRMCARGLRGKECVITLNLTMAFGAESFDAIDIVGRPSISLRVPGGFPGDAGTVNILINAAACVGQLPAGLRTMLDLVPLRCRQ